jgi:hypothetical protein
MASGSASIAREDKKSFGRYCCVVECHSNEGKDGESTKFFSIPKRNSEQQGKWIIAINRENWVPTKKAVVCGKHFVGGKPSPTRADPDYVPSIFPTAHKKARSEGDVSRFKRAMNRRSSTARETTTVARSQTAAEADVRPGEQGEDGSIAEASDDEMYDLEPRTRSIGVQTESGNLLL